MSNDAHDYQFHTSDISADGAKPAPPPNLNGFCLGELPSGTAEPPSKVADCTSSHFIARECSTSPSLAGAFPPDHPGWKRLHHAATWQPDPVLVDRWSWAASKVRDHEHYLKWCSLSLLCLRDPQLFFTFRALHKVQIEATWKQVRELLELPSRTAEPPRLRHAATWQPDPVLVDQWSQMASEVRARDDYLQGCSLSVLSFYYPQMFSEAMALDEVQIEATWKQVRELLGATK